MVRQKGIWDVIAWIPIVNLLVFKERRWTEDRGYNVMIADYILLGILIIAIVIIRLLGE